MSIYLEIKINIRIFISMKKHYVYKIVNQFDIIEYIGETSNPKKRFQAHTTTQGKFNKRKDIELIVLKEFFDKKEAWWYQVELQKQYGFETDNDKTIRAAKRGAVIGGKNPTPILVYSNNTGEFIAEYESQNEAERKLNMRGISQILRSKTKSAKGYLFKLK
jgi:predicted GIY-YIG superfamily endonuclease